MPKALVTGGTGQDGSYLADFLLERGYEVFGMVRRTSTINFDRIRHLQDRVKIVRGDLLDEVSLISILRENDPDEIYNLAAQSFVPTSFEQPVLTGEFADDRLPRGLASPTSACRRTTPAPTSPPA